MPFSSVSGVCLPFLPFPVAVGCDVCDIDCFLLDGLFDFGDLARGDFGDLFLGDLGDCLPSAFDSTVEDCFSTDTIVESAGFSGGISSEFRNLKTYFLFSILS